MIKYKQKQVHNITDNSAQIKTLFDITVSDSNNVTSEIKNHKSNSSRSIKQYLK